MKVLFFSNSEHNLTYRRYSYNFEDYLYNQSYEYYKSNKFSDYYNKSYRRIHGSIPYQSNNFRNFNVIIFESIADSLNETMIEEINQYVINGGNILFLAGSLYNCNETIKLISSFNDVTINNDIVFSEKTFSPKTKIYINYNDIILDNSIDYINGCTFEIIKDVDFYILQDSNTQRLTNPIFEDNIIKWNNLSNEIKPILVYKKHGKGSVLYWGSKDLILKKEFTSKEFKFLCNLIFIFFTNYTNNIFNELKSEDTSYELEFENQIYECKDFNIKFNHDEKFEYENLAYFASGSYKKHYKDLKFKNIYLIDYSAFSPYKYGFIDHEILDEEYYNKDITNDNNILNKRIRIRKNENNNVYLMDMDVFEAVEYFKKNNIKLDCVVNINEGLYEGGGKYSLKSEEFLGYLMPILKREFLYIVEYPRLFDGDYQLLKGKKLIKKLNKFFNYGYNKIILDKNDDKYLDPNIFSDYDWCVRKTVNIFAEKTKPELIKIKLKNNKINFYLLNDSIWNYQNDLDFILTTYSYLYDDFRKIYYKMKNVINIPTDDYMKYDKVLYLLKLLNEKKIKRFGLTPPKFYDIEVVANMLNDYDFNYPKEIILFYLNKNDYKEFILQNRET